MKILQQIKATAITAALVFGAALCSAPVMAAAFTPATDCPAGYTNNAATSLAECFVQDTTSKGGLMSTLNIVLNVVFGVIGFVAVVMLVYGGIQYTVSSGDAAKVKKAKDTILYGIVGLIVALLAAAIVNFVLTGVFK